MHPFIDRKDARIFCAVGSVKLFELVVWSTISTCFLTASRLKLERRVLI